MSTTSISVCEYCGQEVSLCQCPEGYAKRRRCATVDVSTEDFQQCPVDMEAVLQGRTQKLRSQAHDPVNRPAHYADGRIEVIDFIEDKKFGFHLGNAIKYICRAGKKDPSKEIEDLEKAVWCLQRQIARLKSESNPTEL